MKNLTVALTVLGLLGTFAGPSRADILWTWSFSTEEGTFTTDGDFGQTGEPGTFAFLEGSFDVTVSAGGVVQPSDPTELIYFGVGTAAGAFVPGDMNWTGSQVDSFSVPGSGFPELWQGNSSHTGPGRPYIYRLGPTRGRLLEWRGSGSGFVEIASGPLTVTPVAGCDPCDMNCDGDVNAFDIEPFLDLLFNGGTPCDTCTGDANADGNIDAFDIEPFLECLFP